MYTDTGAWDALMGRLARAVTLYLNAQIDAGAQLVQLFDSWVGCLGVDDYRRYVLPHTRSVIEGAAARRAGDPLRHRQSGPVAAVGRGLRQKKRDAWWASIGASGWTTPGERSGTTRPSKAISIRPCCLAEPVEIRRRAKEMLASGRQAGPATSSTSATACCRKRRWRTSSPWSRRSTSSAAANAKKGTARCRRRQRAVQGSETSRRHQISPSMAASRPHRPPTLRGATARLTSPATANRSAAQWFGHADRAAAAPASSSA